MAAGMLESLLPSKISKVVKIVSAGVNSDFGAPASKNAIEVSKMRGIDLSEHKSRRLTRELVQSADLILVMQKMHMDEVRRLCPGRAEHTLLLAELDQDPGAEEKEIADPCGGSVEVYEQCFGQIETSLKKGMGFLIGLIEQKEKAK